MSEKTGRSQAAPETINLEQDDEPAQAQTVAASADDRIGRAASDKPAGASAAIDTPDVIDHMTQMERSGRLDMDAYRGERSDDDEDGQLGESGREDGPVRGAP